MTCFYSFETTAAKIGMIVRTDIMVACIFYLLKNAIYYFKTITTTGTVVKKSYRKCTIYLTERKGFDKIIMHKRIHFEKRRY